MSSSTPARSSTTETAEPERMVLRLRPQESAAPDGSQDAKPKKKSRKKKPRVRWTEDVIDNEHMDKKKSKICCIFHPQREFGEESGSDSSSGSSSDSSSDSDSDVEYHQSHSHGPHGDEGDADGHSHSHSHSHSHRSGRSRAKKSKTARDSSPNAYEKQPNYRKAAEKSAEAAKETPSAP